MSKVSARSKRSKQPARRAPKSGVTAVDRRILAQAAREDAEGDTPPKATQRGTKGPAEVLRDVKERLEEAGKVEPPRMSTTIHPATIAARHARIASDELGGLVVPMTLAQVCEIIGVDCKPDRFAVTALETLGAQLDLVTDLAESTEIGGYDAYRVTENIRQRMLLASRVTAWLESAKPLPALPEVQP